MAAHQLGSTVTAWCSFEALDVASLPDIERTLTDPTSVTVTVTNPSNVVTTPAATKVSTGVYYVNITLNAAGTWTVQWSSTGAAAGVARPTSFQVVA